MAEIWEGVSAAGRPCRETGIRRCQAEWSANQRCQSWRNGPSPTMRRSTSSHFSKTRGANRIRSSCPFNSKHARHEPGHEAARGGTWGHGQKGFEVKATIDGSKQGAVGQAVRDGLISHGVADRDDPIAAGRSEAFGSPLNGHFSKGADICRTRGRGWCGGYAGRPRAARRNVRGRPPWNCASERGQSVPLGSIGTIQRGHGHPGAETGSAGDGEGCGWGWPGGGLHRASSLPCWFRFRRRNEDPKRYRASILGA